MFVVVLLALVLASFGCQPGTGGGGAPEIDGLLSLDAMPRSVAQGGTTTIEATASGTGLTYAWAVAADDAALGTVAAGATAGTAVFTAAADAADGSVATVT